MLLTEDEVRDLTNRKRRDCQQKALNLMGIDHLVRPDGSIAVLRAHLIKVMGGDANFTKQNTVEPNWAAQNA